MFADLISATKRSSGTLVQDACGALALFAMLLVGMNLPDLI